jgi:hypothetical protein
MKKIISLILAALLFCSALTFVSAAEQIEVFVTISTDSLQLAAEKIAVSDADSDGKLTINDALIAAHTAKHPDGAAAYGAADGGYGLAITKLWGIENGGSYGYYVNNISAMSLEDEIKDGDYINAYTYNDLDSYSDMFTYFTEREIKAKTGVAFSLTLKGASFDADWNPVEVAVKNAIITVDGAESDFVTDENGNVEVTLNKPGSFVISATSDSQILVPPVCIVTVEGEENTTQAPVTEQPATEQPTQTPTTVAPVTQAPTTVKKATVKKPYKVRGVKVKAGKRKVTVTFKKAKNAKKYIVKYSTRKNMKKAKTVTTKKLKVTIKKLQSKKRIYVQVQGISGKLKGKLSSRVSAKVK